MANVLVFEAASGIIHNGRLLPHLLEKVERVEKRVFPKNEAMDFRSELKKRNTELVIALGSVEADVLGRDKPVAAYLLTARAHGTALLHKVCVAEPYRRRGMARKMIIDLISRLGNQSCEELQLWVDVQREPALRLYESLGFNRAGTLEDYYGPGRDGLKMVLEIDPRS